MHIGSLLINNGIVPIITEYTRNDIKNITDINEYKLVMEYGIAFNELDCSKHDKEIYNKAIDDFVERLIEELSHTTLLKDGYYLANIIKPLAEQLKAGGENERM